MLAAEQAGNAAASGGSVAVTEAAGAAWTKRMPNWVAMNISELPVLVWSPTKTSVQPSSVLPGGRCSPS